MRKQIVVCAEKPPAGGRAVFVIVMVGLVVWAVNSPAEAGAAVRALVEALAAFVRGL